MGEDFDNHRRIFDGGPSTRLRTGDALQAAAAVRAVFDVDVEDPFEQPGPTQARRRALRVIACGRGCLLWRTGDDFTTQLCVRREHAMGDFPLATTLADAFEAWTASIRWLIFFRSISTALDLRLTHTLKCIL